MKFIDVYQSNKYIEVAPDWHASDSPWKATQVLKMLNRHELSPQTICEVGCGAGGVLAYLQQRMHASCTFKGYDVSPAAVLLSQSKENEHLRYELKDFSVEGTEHYDLMLLIDVIEHVEDYYTFLRNLRPKATYKLLHIPLEITAVNLLRKKTLLKIRETYDIQYFTKDLALAALEDAGYEVLDYMYTPRNLELAPSFKRKLMIPPRKLAFALNQDFACRVLGGFSLLVLAK